MPKNLKKVLVIEDNPVTQQLNKKLLSNDGYQVIEAWDGQSGLKLARSEKPHAILMDVILPDMDGKEVAQRLLKDEATKDIPIIFTTNTVNIKVDKGDQVIAIDGKLCPAFAKPLHHRKLLSTLRKEINKKIHNNI